MFISHVINIVHCTYPDETRFGIISQLNNKSSLNLYSAFQFENKLLRIYEYISTLQVQGKINEFSRMQHFMIALLEHQGCVWNKYQGCGMYKLQ